jgi:hypothetical protein
MSDQQLSIGRKWLQELQNGLLQHDAQRLANIFHPGLTYIVNGNPRPGADSLSKVQVWEFMFQRIEFLRVDVFNVFEVHPGHLFHTIVLRNRNKSTGQEQEGYFIDESVLNDE